MTTGKLLLTCALALSSTAAGATIYRCRETQSAAPATYLRVEVKHIGLDDAPARDGWADLCARGRAACKTDKRGRLHATAYTVNGSDDLIFDPANLQLMHVRTTNRYMMTERTEYGCAALPAADEAPLVTQWRPAPSS